MKKKITISLLLTLTFVMLFTGLININADVGVYPEPVKAINAVLTTTTRYDSTNEAYSELDYIYENGYLAKIEEYGFYSGRKLGNVQYYTRDAAGRVLEVKLGYEEDGVFYNYRKEVSEYDAKGNLIKVDKYRDEDTHPANEREYEFDENSNIVLEVNWAFKNDDSHEKYGVNKNTYSYNGNVVTNYVYGQYDEEEGFMHTQTVTTTTTDTEIVSISVNEYTGSVNKNVKTIENGKIVSNESYSSPDSGVTFVLNTKAIEAVETIENGTKTISTVFRYVDGSDPYVEQQTITTITRVDNKETAIVDSYYSSGASLSYDYGQKTEIIYDEYGNILEQANYDRYSDGEEYNFQNKIVNTYSYYYTYTFVVDGVVYKQESLQQGSGIVLPEAPTKKGYKFVGWDKQVSELTEDVTITAIFEKEGGSGTVVLIIILILLLLLIIYILGYFFLYRKGKLDDKKIRVIYCFLPRGDENKEEKEETEEAPTEEVEEE